MGGGKSKPIDYSKFKVDKDIIEISAEKPTAKVTIISTETEKAKFLIDNLSTPNYTLTYTPNKGVIPGNTSKEISISINFTQPINKTEPQTIHIGDKGEIFVKIKIKGEDGVFGQDPNDLEWTQAGKFRLPKPLATLNDCFVKLDGFHSEGVFRLAGQQGLMKTMKTNMNQNKGTLSIDEEYTINEIANLIKFWFRELPSLLLNQLNTTQIQMAGVEECWKEYQTLNDISRNLLDWLFDLLVQVSQFKDENKMTLQNLAIVVAPNLYESTSSDPMEGLMMSQKAVQFVQNVLTYVAEHRQQE